MVTSLKQRFQNKAGVCRVDEAPLGDRSGNDGVRSAPLSTNRLPPRRASGWWIRCAHPLREGHRPPDG